ncbi:3-methyl-2-oxobutanoate hydroxymethyltransferase [Thermodesulfomicrobium sp. WS]|uniref:3-methyl-2-oxobutanoate hydroxymethyltransferase n=1 Tax=Thermodesulfomicrobium sp. WS TaxID=3004129 RepID=UPI0024931BEF|nr:3-methyl-2-oxobutanoate hydroxymethyltransferase [Thermodesulfomicrobium sp. WS]BDV01287.1 3-methyl-2-oxobutanoate hydroxymethyltransferase [Thermodesulfomicrobium sp. WS]
MKGVLEFAQAKVQGHKLVMVTAYDYPSAYFAEQAGVDLILVGDSVGMVVLGHDSTVPVTMDDMVRHTQAVRRGATDTFIVGDLPFWSTSSVACAVERAGRLVQEGGCHAVKLEGGRNVAVHVEAIVRAGVPVCGHIGLTPQSATALGGFRVQGKTAAQARALLEDAKSLEAAGAFMVVLECVPIPLARVITERLHIPTIGIGAGPHCDGQVLVWHDLLGMYPRQAPKFVYRYADLGTLATKGIATFAEQVRQGTFPGAEQGFVMDEEELARALNPPV